MEEQFGSTWEEEESLENIWLTKLLRSELKNEVDNENADEQLCECLE